ncbi:MAG: tetratricopeptide repeat-containing glycosyltransferase family protein [Myxococcota bacterium]|nr:tetratricopeptide repeat-containing glycosyltransferase family protein [Myxococcota bacterium]
MGIEDKYQEALARLGQGDLMGALELLEEIRGTGFENDTLLNAIGNILKRLKRFDAAAETLNACIQKYGKTKESLSNLAGLYLARKQTREAIEIYGKLLETSPEDSSLLFDIGTCYLEARESLQAAEHFKKALELDNEDPRLWANLGSAYKLRGKLKEALDCFEEASSRAAENHVYRWNIGICQLMLGDEVSGWRHFDSRHHLSGMSAGLRNIPLWNGRQPLSNRRVVVFSEQGIGDFVQFARYISPLVNVAASVTLACPKLLTPLATMTCGGVALLHSKSDCVDAEIQIGIMSLAAVFPNYSPPMGGYLKIRPAQKLKWKKWLDLQELGPMRVGVAWQGNADYREDYLRSIAPEYIIKLARNVELTFVSLHRNPQPGLTENGGSFAELLIVDTLDAVGGAFNDCAGLISNLDLVISSDTSVAHVAAAQGKPVWLLLPRVPDWRWRMHGTDTHWYPSMRLYRQDEDGGWLGLFERLETDLKRLIEESPSRD